MLSFVIEGDHDFNCVHTPHSPTLSGCFRFSCQSIPDLFQSPVFSFGSGRGRLGVQSVQSMGLRCFGACVEFVERGQSGLLSLGESK
jgi:hypothetical protein